MDFTRYKISASFCCSDWIWDIYFLKSIRKSCLIGKSTSKRNLCFCIFALIFILQVIEILFRPDSGKLDNAFSFFFKCFKAVCEAVRTVESAIRIVKWSLFQEMYSGGTWTLSKTRIDKRFQGQTQHDSELTFKLTVCSCRVSYRSRLFWRVFQDSNEKQFFAKQ